MQNLQTSTPKLLSFMKSCESITKPWPLLALVAMALIVLLLPSCRSKESAIASSARITLSGISQPQIMTKSSELSVSPLALPGLGIGQAIAKADTANSTVITVERAADSSFIIRSFAFTPQPIALGPIGLSAECNEPSSPEGFPWSKMFLWFGVIICVIYLFKSR